MKSCADLLRRALRPALCAAPLLLLAACAVGPGAQPDGQDPLTIAYLQALEPMRSENWAKAERSLLRFAEQHPRYSGPWANLAIVYRKTNNREAALDAVDRALALNPSNPAAINQQGILAREAGDFSAAEAAYRRAIAADPAYPLAWLNLGILYDLYLQRSAEALANYEKYKELMGGEVDKQVAGWIADLGRRTGR